MILKKEFVLTFLSCIFVIINAQFNTTLFSIMYFQADLIDNATQIQYTAIVPINHFLGIGYGQVMVNLDIVAFLADPTTPSVESVYATGHF